MNDAQNQKVEVAFPIQLTSSGSSVSMTSDENSTSSNLTIPSLFQENIDQSSVTTPEALTFLQLLNGVDMATPILPPDTLSLVSVWYAFLLEEKLLEEQMNIGTSDCSTEDGEEMMGEGGLLYEDELGLETTSSSSSQLNEEEDQQHYEQYSSALDYTRGMVRTTLPPSKDGSYFVNYIDASNWQRARVQLPRVWLHGVRMEMMDLALFSGDDDDGANAEGGMGSATPVGRVPVKYTLECSVDDDLKRLEIPLFAIPSSYQLTSSSISLQRQVEISNEILQELSHNYNSETSASFLSLSLYHRYNKSGEGSADSPTLNVEEQLLNQLIQMQQSQSLQYCWPTSIRSIIQANGLPMYRPLHQIKEEDQRVLERIYGEGGDGNGNSMEEDDDDSFTLADSSKKEPKKKALTLEQQALQQRLKSAWKIATQKGDSGALEKIQKAMEDLEKELIIEEEEEDRSTLDIIQKAMRDDDEEEVVGLVSDLEEAMETSEIDDTEDEL